MAHAADTHSMIYQNLIDAGCGDETTRRCMESLTAHGPAAMLPTLTAHRAALRDNLRTGQKQLDAVDFLIYQIQKEQY